MNEAFTYIGREIKNKGIGGVSADPQQRSNHVVVGPGTTPAAPEGNKKCDNNTCIQCKSDSNCLNKRCQNDFTSLNRFKCVNCIENSDCCDNFICFEENCVECVRNSDCKNPEKSKIMKLLR